MITFSVFMERFDTPVPNRGDKIVFNNDRYTDKGPASGTIIDINDVTITVMFDEKVILNRKGMEFQQFKKLGGGWSVT